MLHSKKNNQNLKREKEAPKQVTLVFLFFCFRAQRFLQHYYKSVRDL
ncbi:hypothetical protein bthur0013_31180 [Bacillus thuringiensis IBL 200]|nr:hypothetical protein bthur0013_31180 [Bacillus thuringiensis IBL 200]